MTKVNRRHFIKGTGVFLAGSSMLLDAVGASAATASLTVAAAGDIARASSPSKAQVQTQKLVQGMTPDTVLVLGDAQYVDGLLSDYQSSYDPTWGQFKNDTRPASGDHDWNNSLKGYLAYWNLNRSWYSFDVGGWHFICLDSNTKADPSAGSPQCQWLQSDLNNTNSPVIAYFAHPRFSSGAKHGSDTRMTPFWNILYNSGKCQLILNGHEHLYERFNKMTPNGGIDTANGIRQITAGTGGAGLYTFASPLNGSQYRNSQLHGVLKLTLNPSSLDWAWKTVQNTVLDSGTQSF